MTGYSAAMPRASVTVLTAERRRELQAGTDTGSTARTAWRALCSAQGRVAAELDAALQAGHGISLTSYELMRVLHTAPEGRAHMTWLSAGTGLSAAGVTRVVGRLVADGLIRRERGSQDRRILHGILTDAGQRRFAEAEPTYTRVLERVLVPLADPGCEPLVEALLGIGGLPQHRPT